MKQLFYKFFNLLTVLPLKSYQVFDERFRDLDRSICTHTFGKVYDATSTPGF